MILEMGVELYDEGAVENDYAMFVTDNMDTAIKAGFMLFRGDDRETQYLETISGYYKKKKRGGD
jgi:hypothetical protein